jgi:hypothetical protein
MLQSSNLRPYNPYRAISNLNPEPTYSRLHSEFDLVEKLSDQNNELLEQIK